MVPRHSANEIAADRECGQQRTQCWQCGEKKACCALGLLPDWEEPRHDGPATVARLPGEVNVAERTFYTAVTRREYETGGQRSKRGCRR
jgi:hypothetical protein